ncbi:MAG TPA: tetratricopeptide repeat protein [Candidatus Acidoferrales bacterium]|nr:tetratricopeptide repeat protein [Candidatus Binatus sp.]HEV2296989.1 tetratricopeptide repeat protein [Candidatus Acidoferrales bacterium]
MMKLAVALAISSLILVPPAHSLSPQSSASDLGGAKHEFDSGDYASAIQLLRALVSQNSGSAEAHYWLGRSYYETRDFNNAVAELEKAAQAGPNSSVYHQWLGRAYGEKADRDKSFLTARKVKKEFEQAVKLDPSNISARRDLEDYLLEAPWIVGGSKEEGLDQVQAIEKLDTVEGHLARADYDLHVGKKDDAASEYNAVLDPKPQKIEVYFELADYYGKQEDGSQVDRMALEAEKVDSKDPRLAYYHGEARVLMGSDLAVAEQDLKSYLATTPERSDWPSHSAARYWLGRLYEQQGKKMDAAEQYRASLQLDPGRKDAKKRLEQLEKSIH